VQGKGNTLLQKLDAATPLSKRIPVTSGALMTPWALILVLTLASGSAFAQRGERDQKGPPGKNQGMSKDQRQRMREDMRNVYQDRSRPQQQRQMSPQEREKLRRDIQDANKDLRR